MHREERRGAASYVKDRNTGDQYAQTLRFCGGSLPAARSYVVRPACLNIHCVARFLPGTQLLLDLDDFDCNVARHCP